MKIFNVVAVLIFSSFSLKAIDGKFYKGSDSIIAQSQLASFFCPSQRYGLVKVFESIRFHQTTGPWNPEIPAHPQSLAYDGGRDKPLYGPQSFFDSLVQLLFPSPDGTTLMSNQASSDRVSEFTPQDMAALIQLAQNPEVKIENIRSSIFPEIEFSDELIEKYQAFLKYEHFRQVVDKTYSALGDADYEKREISPQDPNRASKVLRLAAPQYFRGEGLQEGDVEVYALGQEVARFLSSKKPSKPQLEKIKHLEEKHPDILFFERNRKAFTAYRFADTLLKALKENSSPIENGVEKALLSYMWLKFRKDEDRRAFYKELGVVNADQIFAEEYERSDYNTVKSTQIGLLSPEELALYRYGFDLFENPFPRPLPYSTATVVLQDRDYSFSDCAESAVLSLLLYKVRKLSNGRYKVDPAVFPETSPLRGFFEKYEEEDLYTTKAHDDFAQMVCNLAEVNYLKPAGDPKKKFELKPGLLNLLRVLGALIPELKDLKILNQNSEETEIQRGINSLAQYLAPEGKRWTARIYGQGYMDYMKNLRSEGEIYKDVLVGDNIAGESPRNIFCWTNSPGHSNVSLCRIESVSFSEDAEQMRKDPLKLAFLTLSNLRPYWEDLSNGQFSQVFLQTEPVINESITVMVQRGIENLYLYVWGGGYDWSKLIKEDESLSLYVFKRLLYGQFGHSIYSAEVQSVKPKYRDLLLAASVKLPSYRANIISGYGVWLFKKKVQDTDFHPFFEVTIDAKSIDSIISFVGQFNGLLLKNQMCFNVGALDLFSSSLETWLSQRKAKTQIHPTQIIGYDNINETEDRIRTLYEKFPHLFIDQLYSTGSRGESKSDLEEFERLNRALGSRKPEKSYEY